MNKIYIVIDGSSYVEGSSQEIVRAFSTEQAAIAFVQKLLEKLEPSTKRSDSLWLRNQHSFGCDYIEIKECEIDDDTIPDDYCYITCPECNDHYTGEICEKCNGTGSILSR